MKKIVLSAFLVMVACALSTEARAQIGPHLDPVPDCESPEYWGEFVPCYMGELALTSRVCDLSHEDQRVSRYVAYCRFDAEPLPDDYEPDCQGSHPLDGVALPMCIIEYLDQGWNCTARNIGHLEGQYVLVAVCEQEEGLP